MYFHDRGCVRPLRHLYGYEPTPLGRIAFMSAGAVHLTHSQAVLDLHAEEPRADLVSVRHHPDGVVLT